MSKKEKPLNLASGMWKFKEGVFLELVQIAQEWAKGSDGHRYLEIHIRKCSKDQYGIGFQYEHDGQEDYQAFFDRITDQLRRRFGNDFVGWDVASITHVIK